MSPSKLHDIKPVSRKKNTKVSQNKSANGTPQTTSLKRNNYHMNHRIHRSKKSSGSGLWFLVIVIIIGLFFGFSVIFSSAEVSVVPQSKNVLIETELTAFKRSAPETILFDVFVMNDELTESVLGDFDVEVYEPARGVVRIYNSHGPESQNLAIDTRLIDSNGRIYKTIEKVTVPGISIIEGEEVPGFVDVDIYASDVGSEYNHEGSSLRLSILGFQESANPKFETIYAETLTPLLGGFSGLQKTVSEDIKNNLISEMKETIKDNLYSRAVSQISENTFLVEGMQTLDDFEVFEFFNKETELLDITVRTSLRSVVFNKNSFEKYIILNYMNNVTQEDVYVTNLESLNISFVDRDLQTTNLSQLENLLFNLNDTVNFVWNVNKDKLVFDLVGRRKRDFVDIIKKYPSISSASLKMSPFWRWKMPEVGEDIKVIII